MPEEKMLLDIMSADPVILDAEQTAMEAAQIMRERGIGAVLVEQEDGTIGLITDRDLTLRALATGAGGHEIPLGRICTQQPSTLQAENPVTEAVKLMREQAVRRVPILEGSKTVGIVSLGDLAVDRDRHSVLGKISSEPPNN